MDNHELARACRDIAAHFEGDVAVPPFDYYDALNRRLFNGTLPQAFILTGITPYGNCIGLTRLYFKQPIILLHQGLETEQERFYTLLHETIHVHVHYVLGYRGKKSHDSDEWISEINRIAPLLGYHGIVLGVSKVSRIPKREGGGLRRISTGTVPYECSYGFPQALANHTQIPLPPYQRWLGLVPSTEKHEAPRRTLPDQHLAAR